jgi:hypothetical protein
MFHLFLSEQQQDEAALRVAGQLSEPQPQEQPGFFLIT